MINIKFYNYNKENYRVDKTNYLSDLLNLTGEFESVINIQIPKINVEYDTLNFGYNYCYIVELNRWYFIKDITYLNVGIISIDLQQDLLMTYKDRLMTTEGFVERNEYDFNKSLEDKEINFKYDKKVKEGYINNQVIDSLVNTTFDNNNNENYYFVASVLNNNNQGYAPQNAIPPSTSGLNEVFLKYTNQQIGCYYALKWINLNTLCNFVFQNESRLSSIKSVIGLPYQINFEVDSASFTGLYVNDELIDDNKIYPMLLKPTSNYLITNHFFLSNSLDIVVNNFYYKNPYSKFELYIPFLNWIELPIEQIFNKEMLLYYIVDYNTGLADVYLKNKTDNIILLQSTCQLGIKLGLSSSNQELINTQQNANKLNLTLGLIGSGISIVGGLASSNPIALGYGALGAANQIANYTNSNAMMFSRNVYQASNGLTQLFSERKMKYRLTYIEPSNDYEIIKKYKGLLLNENRILGNLKGFSKISSIRLNDLYFYDNQNNKILINLNEKEELTNILNEGVIFENE